MTATTVSLGFYRGACDAVVQYAREEARLPAFRFVHPHVYYDFSRSPFRTTSRTPHPTRPTVARLLSFGAADRTALDLHADNIWLTLQPFDDLPPGMPDETALALLAKRVRFLRLLARLTNDPERYVTGWHHHYRAQNKMADKAANIAMDARRSVQALAQSAREEITALYPFLASDCEPWVERLLLSPRSPDRAATLED